MMALSKMFAGRVIMEAELKHEAVVRAEVGLLCQCCLTESVGSVTDSLLRNLDCRATQTAERECVCMWLERQEEREGDHVI